MIWLSAGTQPPHGDPSAPILHIRDLTWPFQQDSQYVAIRRVDMPDGLSLSGLIGMPHSGHQDTEDRQRTIAAAVSDLVAKELANARRS